MIEYYNTLRSSAIALSRDSRAKSLTIFEIESQTLKLKHDQTERARSDFSRAVMRFTRMSWASTLALRSSSNFAWIAVRSTWKSVTWRLIVFDKVHFLLIKQARKQRFNISYGHIAKTNSNRYVAMNNGCVIIEIPQERPFTYFFCFEGQK